MPDGTRERDAPKGEGLLEGTLFALVTQVTTALFTAGLTLYLVRALGAEGFGLFSLALSVSAIGLLVSDAALSRSAGRFVADRRDSARDVADVVAAGLRLKVILGMGVSVALAALAGPIADIYGKPDLAWPLRGIALSLFAESLLLLWEVTFMSMRRLALNARVIFVESLVEATASIALVALGGGVTGAAFGRAAGYGAGAAFAMVLARRLLGRRAFAVRSASPALRGEVRRYARPLFATNSAYTAYATTDVQLIAALLPTSAVGLWSAPFKLLNLLGYVGQSVANAVAPRMALGSRSGPDARAFSVGLRWLLILHAAVVAGVVAWAEPITMLLLGPDFSGSVDVLRALTPVLLLRGISPLISESVNYIGEAGRRLPIVLASLTVNFVIDLTLLPVIGITAAAIGTGVAYCLYVPAHLRLCRRAFPVPLRPLVVTGLRALVAGAAMCGALALIGTSDLSVWQWTLGAVVGPLVYVLVLVATRELHEDDLEAARAAVRRRLNRR
jgi:O-antigen/teichoic acid export membrane protein